VNVDEVHARVALIAAVQGDNERAHAEEDKLLHDVLHAIAYGTPEPTAAVLAHEALRVKEIDYVRWYA